MVIVTLEADEILSPWWVKIIVDYENPLRGFSLRGAGGWVFGVMIVNCAVMIMLVGYRSSGRRYFMKFLLAVDLKDTPPLRVAIHNPRFIPTANIHS